jgi:hypothetical protein
MRIAGRRFHVDLLSKISIEEGIFDIHLKEFPVFNSSNNDEAAN